MSNDLSIARNVLGEDLTPDSISIAVENAATIIPRLVEEWCPNAHHDKFPPRKPGELSYFIPGSTWGPFDRGQNLALAYDRGLTALLYVHRIVINSPLLMLSSASMRGKGLEWQKDLLLASLHLLASLRELIDAGIVVIVGSDANYHASAPVKALVEEISHRKFGDLEYGLRHSIEFSLTSGCAIDIFANSDAEYQQLQKIFAIEDDRYLVSRSDALHLSALLEEVVPDAADLDLKEVLRIRQDDTFEQWRSELRSAIRRLISVNNTPGLEGEGSEEFQILMREKSSKLNESAAIIISRPNFVSMRPPL
ncbi:MAG TPA: hypothetical protein VHZ03_51260 [Trebonia sp.]|jgi:hypothetical protein|nr:hypothetical protein [Trebonia sp.]